MKSVRVTRSVQIPDLLRLSRYRKAPELGPRVLFFSGGTALNGVSRLLKNYTFNSIHMVTPFDSGGSSAKLRKAFAMPSIGDLRSRLMALADETVIGHPEIYQLFNTRFPLDGQQKELLKQLELMQQGKDPLVDAITNPMRRLIRNQLGYFREAMPDDFDLRGASIGNLILTGGYLNNHQHLDPIIFLFSKLAVVHGTVRAVINDNLHLAAELKNGKTVIGQHLLTGKEVAPIKSPIKNLLLSHSVKKLEPASPGLRKKNRKLIRNAELICYPPGSFYSSLVAALLPEGVTSAIAENDCPKVYVPNLGQDPEQLGMSMDQFVQTLLKYLRKGVAKQCDNGNLINFVLLDSKRGSYPGELSAKLMNDLGIQIIDTRLISEASAPYYDDELLVAALLSLT